MTPESEALKFGRDSKKSTVDVAKKWIFDPAYFHSKEKKFAVGIAKFDDT